MAEGGTRNTWTETKEGIEYFLQGKHLQSVGWDCLGSYKYIPDSEVGCSELKHYCKFRVKSLIHATTPKAASDIIKGGGFKPNFKRLQGAGGLHLVWWGIALEESDINQYTEQCRMQIASALSNQFETSSMKEWMGNFCSSTPFTRESRYGNIMFEYSPREVFNEYSSQFCGYGNPLCYVMGTFAYKQEVMHAILVCPPNQYKEVYPLAEPGVSIIYWEGGFFIWNPETTGDRNFGEYRRWEHATFAFWVPEDHLFTLNNSDMHISYCLAADVFRLHTSEDRRRWTFDETLSFLHEHKVLQPIQFLSMIHKHIVKVLRLKVNMRFENYNNPCQDCTKYAKIRPGFLQILLNGEIGDEENLSLCPHELHQMVRKAPTRLTKRWQLWIREITHYLPSE